MDVAIVFLPLLAAAIAGLALTHTIGRASMKGLVTNSEPFFRTPKKGESARLLHALAAAREELLMMLGLWLAAWGVSHCQLQVGQEGPDRLAWIVVLMIQSVPYASSVLASLASAFPLPARLLGSGYRRMAVPRRRVEADSPS